MIYPEKVKLSYPKNLRFSNAGMKKFAQGLLPYSKAFFVGKILSEKDDSWNNCFFHCLKAALVTEIIANELNKKLDVNSKLDAKSMKNRGFFARFL